MERRKALRIGQFDCEAIRNNRVTLKKWFNSIVMRVVLQFMNSLSAINGLRATLQLII